MYKNTENEFWRIILKYKPYLMKTYGGKVNVEIYVSMLDDYMDLRVKFSEFNGVQNLSNMLENFDEKINDRLFINLNEKPDERIMSILAMINLISKGKILNKEELC